jgi:xanthine dehydrogenase accessory factor
VLGSVTIGGCVDAQFIEESAAVLESMRPRLLELDLGDEEAWEIGLTCGGTIEVLVEPLALDRPDDPAGRLYARARTHAARQGHAALLTRLDGGHGAKRLVLDDGTVEGSLGDPAIDEALTEEARDAMARSTSYVVTRGDARVFVEVIAPPALLLVVGAGHVAMPLTSMAKLLGYRTAVLDARPRFATRERFPDADDVRVGVPSELVREYPLVPSTALVLVAHDYKHDIPVLATALATGVGYVGMLGSTRRGAAILGLLREDGVSDAALERVHVPIGLDLGARSAGEIALAILAEIQAVRGGGTGRPLSVTPRTGGR